jgi:hypothetical protein
MDVAPSDALVLSLSKDSVLSAQGSEWLEGAALGGPSKRNRSHGKAGDVRAEGK